MDTGEGGRGWVASLLLLAAFSLFSPLSLLEVNARRGAPVVKFLVVSAVFFGLAALVAALVARRLGRRRATSLVCALLLAFFSWSAVLELGRRLRLGWVMGLVLLALLMWAGWRFGDTAAFQTSMAAVGVALMATPLPGLVAWYGGEPIRIEVPTPVDGSTTTNLPDVYFVVLDGYGRGDVLESLYGFGNREFIGELEDRGFQVPPESRANYTATAGSVASTLAMDYLVAAGAVSDHRLRLALYEVIGGANPVVEGLRGSGYRYVHIESGWDGARCGPNVDTCHGAAFLDEAVWTLLGRTPAVPLAEKAFGHAFALNGLRALESLEREAGRQREEPRLVFAHVLLPHPPLTLDRRCSVREEPQPPGGAVGSRQLRGTEELDRRKAGYVEQIECVNSHVLRFLDEVDDDALVFITGDHGPDSYGQMSVPPPEWTAEEIRERLAVLSAYRLPAACTGRVNAGIDLINGMRTVVSCALDVELPPLGSRFYIYPLPDQFTEKVVDVTIVGSGG